MPKTITIARGILSRIFILCPVVATAPAWGDPPIQQLPAPHYSFGLGSPSAAPGNGLADAILTLGPLEVPLVATGGEVLGLGGVADDLDALSAANTQVLPGDHLALLFSVDAGTVGLLLPAPDLVAQGVPYNAKNQAMLGHQAADQYLSLGLFQKGGGPQLVFNNVLVRNNYNEGGTDFAAVPNIGAAMTFSGDSQDEVDATAVLVGPKIYFSTTAASTSLAEISSFNAISGAHIFVVSTDSTPPVLSIYATAENLGLHAADDLDALIVFDANNDGSFNAADQVLFSLTPASPSLQTIIDAGGAACAADVLTVSPGQMPEVFAPAHALGLGHPDDNVDALDYLLCNDTFQAAVTFGIRQSGPGWIQESGSNPPDGGPLPNQVRDKPNSGGGSDGGDLPGG